MSREVLGIAGRWWWDSENSELKIIFFPFQFGPDPGLAGVSHKA
jgi:hypothetical protein